MHSMSDAKYRKTEPDFDVECEVPNSLTGRPHLVILLGAQKCASTTLSELLNLHPDICLAKNKEPAFFNTNWERGAEWYRAQFTDTSAKIWLDASVTYSQCDLDANGNSIESIDIPARIHSLYPDAKFIYVVRDPVERTYAGYLHTKRHRRESRPFSEVLKQRNNYEDTSNYAAQLKIFLAHFEPERFFVAKFEDVATDLEGVFRRIEDFLGVRPMVIGSDDFGRHRNKAYELTGFGNLVRNLFPGNDSFKKGINIIRRMIPKSLEGFAANLVRTDPPKIGHQESDILRQRFAPKIKELEKITGIDFSDWTRT